jgi:hypothetical protein
VFAATRRGGVPCRPRGSPREFVDTLEIRGEIAAQVGRPLIADAVGRAVILARQERDVVKAGDVPKPDPSTLQRTVRIAVRVKQADAEIERLAQTRMPRSRTPRRS